MDKLCFCQSFENKQNKINNPFHLLRFCKFSEALKTNWLVSTGSRNGTRSLDASYEISIC